MLKKSLLSLAVLLSVISINADAGDWRSDVLSAQDLALIDNAQEMYCYLNPEFVDAVCSLSGNLPTIVRDMQRHVANHAVASLEYARKAVDATLNCYRNNPAADRSQMPAVEEYKAALECGDAVFMPEAGVRGKKCKKFCKLLVKNCLRAGSLRVCGNAQIGGDLCATTINGLAFAGSDFTFNCDGLSPVGSSCESLLNDIRGTFCPNNVITGTILPGTTPSVLLESTDALVPGVIPSGCYTVTPVTPVAVVGDITPTDLSGTITIDEGTQVILSYRVTFNGTPFASQPVVVVTLESEAAYGTLPFGPVGGVIIDNLIVNVSNVDTTGFNVNFVLFPEIDYPPAGTLDELARVLTLFAQNICVDFIVQAPQAVGTCEPCPLVTC